MVTADLFKLTKCSVLKDLGSGHRQVLAEIKIPRADQRPFQDQKFLGILRRQTGLSLQKLLEQGLSSDKLDFSLNPNKIYRIIKDTIISCAKRSIPRGKQKKYKSFWTDELTSLKAKRDRLRRRWRS
ncbi:hypothetical protein CEXT_214611 [Caerostris extrusa]|uniref:Uncharacterized protein n=1 Tax=Caerostris extrusa TaxID=172846 RepID=A0AAV4M7N1_CAEEX|nr:hypothetical protein CEXT_214611 [Caerostris extrusa]